MHYSHQDTHKGSTELLKTTKVLLTLCQNKSNKNYALISLIEDSNHIPTEIQMGRFTINHNQIFDTKQSKGHTVIHLTITLTSILSSKYTGLVELITTSQSATTQRILCLPKGSTTYMKVDMSFISVWYSSINYLGIKKKSQSH